MSIKRVTHNSIVDALDAILRSLYNYEQKFHIPSDEFYRGYLEGKFEDTKDFVEWAGDYQHYLDLKRELEEKLKVSL